MSLFEKHHTMTPDQHVAAANARFRLRMHMYNVRLRYERSVEMRTAFENLATGGVHSTPVPPRFVSHRRLVPRNLQPRRLAYGDRWCSSPGCLHVRPAPTSSRLSDSTACSSVLRPDDRSVKSFTISTT